MKIRFRDGSTVCSAGPGEPVLPACARGGFILSAPCGGRGRCGKCRVRLLEGRVSGDAPDAEGFVRACQAVPVTDITIELPAENLSSFHADYAEISGAGTGPAKPWSAGSRAGPPESGAPGPACSAVSRAGIALDIGTTTVSARLVDLDTSRVLDTVSELNDQRVFGADVISRIGAARNGKTHELFQLINHQTERIIRILKERRGLSKIERLSVSGNTTMLHLFLNVDPSGLGELPFTPVFLEEREIKGALLSLPVEQVNVLPSISAFIGSDVCAALAVLDVLNIPDPCLLIDIGTNGEMALVNRGNILCCSTAAGPAFEGAEISCGAGGIAGAISAVELATGADSGQSGGLPATGCSELPVVVAESRAGQKPDSHGDSPAAGRIPLPAGNRPAFTVSTIGNAPPLGICGSGLIDAVAIMLKLGIIDETGAMTGLEREFFLAPGISISARDVRQFQLAKSAILSGIRILCKNAGLGLADVKNVFIAGGFGFFINKKNAVVSGIFPEEFLDSITVSGNLSLEGAAALLSEKDFMERCRQIKARCSIIDLAADPCFADEFTENMLFGGGAIK